MREHAVKQQILHQIKLKLLCKAYIHIKTTHISIYNESLHKSLSTGGSPNSSVEYCINQREVLSEAERLTLIDCMTQPFATTPLVNLQIFFGWMPRDPRSRPSVHSGRRSSAQSRSEEGPFSIEVGSVAANASYLTIYLLVVLEASFELLPRDLAIIPSECQPSIQAAFPNTGFSD
jgi:hypothetical protein